MTDTCMNCKKLCAYGSGDYDCIFFFQTGYCGKCLTERFERGEEW